MRRTTIRVIGGEPLSHLADLVADLAGRLETEACEVSGEYARGEARHVAAVIHRLHLVLQDADWITIVAHGDSPPE